MHHKFTIDQARESLQIYWKYPDFRDKQKELFEKLADSKNIIALLPTGAGKSICYQLPALLYPGVTLVISPLISLMEDQVLRLKNMGIRAESIHSGKPYREIDRILDNCVYGEVRLLYVSPERLSEEMFCVRMQKITLDLIAVDEAHCISQWGHDFRPAYLRILDFTAMFPDARIMALTATATARVLGEIRQYLGIGEAAFVRDSFLRTNLQIGIEKHDDKIGALKNFVAACSGKIIIYCRSRRKVEMIAGLLRKGKHKTAYYHAGLEIDRKKKIQSDFSEGKLDILVATNAFGMGIDVADIRAVIHFGIPPSIEEYYQEIGRAGRDGLRSETLLVYDKGDLEEMNDKLELSFPPFEYLRKVYKAIHVYFKVEIGEGEERVFPLIYDTLALATQIPQGQIYHVIECFRNLGIFELQEEDQHKYFVHLDLDPGELRVLQSTQHGEAGVLDYLMRSQEGIFDYWVEIGIKGIATACDMKPDQLLECLVWLRDRSYLRMYHSAPGLKIRLLRNRLSSIDFDIFQMAYDQLKRIRKIKTDGICDLIREENCRFINILSYFDEQSLDACGQCDNCRKREEAESEIPTDSVALEKFIIQARKKNQVELIDKIQRLIEEGVLPKPVSMK